MKFFLFLLMLIGAVAGFYFQTEKQVTLQEWPVTSTKPFVIALYARNQAPWCKKALLSIFRQNYDQHRIIAIDDGSSDETYNAIQQTVIDNHEEHRVLLLRNERPIGFLSSLYRALDSCQELEIILPLDAKDLLASDTLLSRLNQLYQNPDVWLVSASALNYPSYERSTSHPLCFYKALFQEIHAADFFSDGHPTPDREPYFSALRKLAGSHIAQLEEPLSLCNLATPQSPPHNPLAPPAYAPLAQLPKPQQTVGPDLLLFSFDRPMQLFACLESIETYFTGINSISVLYRISAESFAEAYEIVKKRFPTVHFEQQSILNPRKDFKPMVMKMVFEESSSPYILFGVDDQVVKDYADLSFCTEQLERSGAYGFYLRFGRHITQSYMANNLPQMPPPPIPLTGDTFLWDLRTGEFDWAFANTVDMTIYRKSDIKKIFQKIKFRHPNSLEEQWAQHSPERHIGLYFETSKVLNLPLNVLSGSTARNMQSLGVEELLMSFNQGWKFDIRPLYRVENRSPHWEFVPTMVPR